MKFTITKNRFAEAIAKAERIAGKNLSLPVLRCVLIVAQDNVITIRATNLDLGIEMKLPATITTKGTVAIPADTLHGFLSALSTQSQVDVEQEGTHVIISSQKSTTKIASYPHEDFPTLPRVEGGELFKIQGKEFAQGLKSVWWSATSSSIKPELSSIYVYSDGDMLVMVATDSFRLAEKKIHAKKTGAFESILIPLKNISEIIRHSEQGSEISVFGDSYQIAFHVDDTYITSRVIDGTFPDYKQIIPGEFESEIIALKQDCIDALKHARVFSDQFNKLTITIDTKEKQVTFNTINAEIGEALVSIDAAVSGAPLQMHFNHQYVLDVFSSLTTDSVSFSFSGTGKPMLIKPVGDASFSYIVMPMNR